VIHTLTDYTKQSIHIETKKLRNFNMHPPVSLLSYFKMFISFPYKLDKISTKSTMHLLFDIYKSVHCFNCIALWFNYR